MHGHTNIKYKQLVCGSIAEIVKEKQWVGEGGEALHRRPRPSV
jgi:hypothetical protein